LRRNTLLVDAAIAAAVAIGVLIISPGLAVTAIIAIIVLVVCGVSLLIDIRRSRGRRTRY
jgi:hypothetical protein